MWMLRSTMWSVTITIGLDNDPSQWTQFKMAATADGAKQTQKWCHNSSRVWAVVRRGGGWESSSAGCLTADVHPAVFAGALWTLGRGPVGRNPPLRRKRRTQRKWLRRAGSIENVFMKQANRKPCDATRSEVCVSRLRKKDPPQDSQLEKQAENNEKKKNRCSSGLTSRF